MSTTAIPPPVLQGSKNVLVATTGYTGAGGIEIYFDIEAEKIWRAVMEGGAILAYAVGLAARDTLRLEMGYCLYGNEIDDQSSPISAGLGWVSKPLTGFLNASLHQRSMKRHTRKTVGFQIDERGIPRSGYLLYDSDENSLAELPQEPVSSLSKGIGLGYVETDFPKPEKNICRD